MKARAALEGRHMREVIIDALREYMAQGVDEAKSKKVKR